MQFTHLLTKEDGHAHTTAASAPAEVRQSSGTRTESVISTA